MKPIIQKIWWKVETEMRRGKSTFEAHAVAAMEARDRQERQGKAVTGAWVDEVAEVPNAEITGRQRETRTK